MTFPTRLFWSLLIVAAVAVGVVVMILALRPPHDLTMAAGPVDGAYHRIALKYRAILARDGIALHILDTAGSVQNARLIADGTADAALIQGGIDVPSDSAEAIGTLFYEPLLILFRSAAPVSPNPVDWSGLRINAGTEGSGTRAAFTALLQAAGVPAKANTLTDLPYSEAVDALDEDAIDIAAFVAPIDAPYLRMAYDRGHFSVLQLDYTEALSRRIPGAELVHMPPGAVSLSPPVPPAARQFIALRTRLAIRGHLHPALVNRLTMAALEIHGARSVLENDGDFPSVAGTDLPVNNAARQLIVSGPTIWHDWLPYWMAAQLNRVLILLLPLFLIVLPLLRSLPGLYAFAQNYRVWQKYPLMRAIEDQLESGSDPETLDLMSARLLELDDHLAHLRMPAAFRQTAFEARMHIDLLQRRIMTERQRNMSQAE